jgi:integrase
MPKVLLTAASVRQAECPAAQRKLDLFDTHTKGLMLEVRPAGKTFYLRYQSDRGTTRQMRLGDTRDISLQMARRLADRARAKRAAGEDPSEAKILSRKVMTLNEFLQKQYVPYVASYKRSLRTELSLLKNHLQPRFGAVYMDEIKRSQIQEMLLERRALGAAPSSANRLVILLQHVFSMALKWEVPGVKENPCKGISLFQENNKRECFLSHAEAVKLNTVLQQSDNKLLKHIVAMLLLTGTRKQEVLGARWVDFDLERRVWRIPLSKSGKARHVPLSDGMMALLKTIPHRDDQALLFANPSTGKAFTSLHRGWDNARKKAGLNDLRIHDLRHSFASFLINGGRSLYEVQRILGHARSHTTQRYAHLSQGSLLEAADVATKMVGDIFLPGKPTISK